MRISHRRRLSRKQTIQFLEETEAVPQTAVSLYLPAGLAKDEAQNALNRAVKTAEIAAELGELAQSSKTGFALIWGTERQFMILPPFPLAGKSLCDGYHVEPLRSLLKTELRIGVMLVRLGEYAIGVFRGEELLSSKNGTGLVHSRHHQGGSSQGRFARHREKQIESFFTRVCGHARTQLEPYSARLDYLIYGGERNTLLKFRKQCSFLEKFDARTMSNVLNVRYPNKASLEESIVDIWASELIEFARD